MRSRRHSEYILGSLETLKQPEGVPKMGRGGEEGGPREMPEETLCKAANLSETVRAFGVGVTLGTARG